MSSNAAILNLVNIILSLAAQYGPGLVKDISNLIHQNPQQPGETTQQYIDRLNPIITANLDAAAANDASVEG
jgi:hypothetical protein